MGPLRPEERLRQPKYKIRLGPAAVRTHATGTAPGGGCLGDSGRPVHTGYMDQNLPTFTPAFGWAYLSPRPTVRTQLHFFHGTGRFTLSLCGRYTRQDHPFVDDPKPLPKCARCLGAGTSQGIFN